MDQMIYTPGTFYIIDSIDHMPKAAPEWRPLPQLSYGIPHGILAEPFTKQVQAHQCKVLYIFTCKNATPSLALCEAERAAANAGSQVIVKEYSLNDEHEDMKNSKIFEQLRNLDLGSVIDCWELQHKPDAPIGLGIAICGSPVYARISPDMNRGSFGIQLKCGVVVLNRLACRMQDFYR